MSESESRFHSTRLEYCRELVGGERCDSVADFILWGKLLPKAALGPRCYPHAYGHLGSGAMSMLDQYAVYDLRPVHAQILQEGRDA